MTLDFLDDKVSVMLPDTQVIRLVTDCTKE